jgi:hypothetical protein
MRIISQLDSHPTPSASVPVSVQVSVWKSVEILVWESSSSVPALVPVSVRALVQVMVMVPESLALASVWDSGPALGQDLGQASGQESVLELG